ncbi:MAG: hypothetical protein ACRCX2_01935 [Paraclostridium sp.]
MQLAAESVDIDNVKIEETVEEVKVEKKTRKPRGSSKTVEVKTEEA